MRRLYQLTLSIGVLLMAAGGFSHVGNESAVYWLGWLLGTGFLYLGEK